MKKEGIFNIVKEAIEFVVPEVDTKSLSAEESLKEIGANSIDRAEIISIAIDNSNVRIPMVSFKDAKNIAEIVDVIFKAQ